MPQVSVITPTYNRADMIGGAIQSVLHQTYPDWELIVVDDGSTDNTAEVVAACGDPRVKYIYQENRKLPGARNTGLRAAQGEYVAFLDSDDLFLPHKLERQLDAFAARPELGLVAGGYIEVDAKLSVLREVRPWLGQPALEFRDWLLGCPFCPGAALVQRQWVEMVSLFDEQMPYVEDWDLWLRMSHLGCPMDWVTESTCCYRIHGGNMVRNVLAMKRGMVTMLDKLYNQADLSDEILALRDRAYANVYLSAAARAYAAGAIEEGKVWLRKSVEFNPALLQGDPPRALDTMASFALEPLAGDAGAFVDRLMSNLPKDAGIPRWPNHRMRGLLHGVAAFDYYQRRRYQDAVRSALLAIVLDPRWLRNRGLLSITGRSMARSLQSPRSLLVKPSYRR